MYVNSCSPGVMSEYSKYVTVLCYRPCVQLVGDENFLRSSQLDVGW